MNSVKQQAFHVFDLLKDQDQALVLKLIKRLAPDDATTSDGLAAHTASLEDKNMANLYIKLIHPTNNSDIDVGLPKNILLKDVLNQLVGANFLSPDQPYTGVLKAHGLRMESTPLDNNKTVSENDIQNGNGIGAFLCFQNQTKQ